jgi:hypothetical protein
MSSSERFLCSSSKFLQASAGIVVKLRPLQLSFMILLSLSFCNHLLIQSKVVRATDNVVK